ncbi:DNA-directed RNA polymerase subunit omega [bacterium]|nr:DNA-directed RNA polymerase subunit omega [bacterium]
MSNPAITEMTTDDLEKTITDKISLSEPEVDDDLDLSDEDEESPDIVYERDVSSEDDDDGAKEANDDDEDDNENNENNDEDNDEITSAKISSILGNNKESDDSDNGSEEEDDGDDEEYDENTFQKLENDINTDKLLIYHPELLQSNYKEINALSKIARNKKGLIIDPLHKTVPFLTKYERARVLGIRIKQLNNDADPFVEVVANTIDARFIAEEELKQGKIPFIIRRPLPNGGNEYWKLSDLEVIEY